MYLTGCHLAIDLPEAVWREFAGSDVPDDTWPVSASAPEIDYPAPNVAPRSR